MTGFMRGAAGRLRAGIVLGALLVAALAADPARSETVTTYQVQRGDTLAGLSARYLISPNAYREVARLNRVGDPRRLIPGRTLRIPDRLLRTEPVIARLVAYRGEVSVRLGGAEVPIVMDMATPEGAVVATGAGAFATLEMPDGSRVSLPSQSRVRIVTLRRVILGDRLIRRFVLESGRGTLHVTPAAQPGNDFTVTTPLTVSAVRGTVFRVAHDPEASRSALEVVEGTVANQSIEGAAPADLAAGFGRIADIAGPQDVRPLLGPPTLIAPGRVQDEETLDFTVATLSGALAYRLQIGGDAGFVDTLAEATAQGPTVSFPTLAAGTYFVRVTGIDAAGLEGLPAVFAFERRLNRLDLEAPAADAGRQFRFRWADAGAGAASFRFQLSRAEDMSEPVVDEAGLTERRISITNLPDGVYFWRVRVTRFEDGQAFEKWSPVQRFQLGS